MFYAEAAQENALAAVDPITSADLQTTAQQSRGYGDDVARILELPPRGNPNPGLLQTTLSALPPKMTDSLLTPRGEAKYSGPELARKALYHAALAMTYGNAAEQTVEMGYDESQTAYAATQAILLALGYKQLSDAMVLQVSPEETRPGVAPAPPIKFLWGRNQEEIAVSTPYDEQFITACRNNRRIFLRFEQGEGGAFFRFFRPENVPNVVNILSGIWANAFCYGVEGNLTVLPTRPFVEVPFPVVPLPPMIEVRATGERPAPPIFSRGDRVRYEGNPYVVVDASPGTPQRLGLRPAGSGDGPAVVFTTVEGDNVTPMIDAAQAVAQIQADNARAAQQDGEPPPAPVSQEDLDSLAGLQIPESAFDYQVEGIKWMWLNRRGILGDEAGLGKTLQAVCAAEFPCLVVCTAKLKVNWLREFGKWRPGTSCAIVSGTSRPPAETRNADVVIINYDILVSHAEWIKARRFATIAVDEAHNLKNMAFKAVTVPSTERYGQPTTTYEVRSDSPQRAIKFYEIQKENPDARLYLITGTAMMNARTKEIFPLLHMVDNKNAPLEIRHTPSYSPPVRPWQDYKFFCHRYAFERTEEGAPAHRRRARRGAIRCDGASNLSELHALAAGKSLAEVTSSAQEGGRRSPYTRLSPPRVYYLRRKKDLLNLPPLVRQIKHVSLSDEGQREYRRAVENFVGYIRQLRGSAAALRASLGAMLSKMNGLRRIAAAGKVEALLQDIVEFRNGTGRPLIVMAYHRVAMEGLIKGFDELNRRVGQPDGPNEAIRYGVCGWEGGRSAREEETGELSLEERAQLARTAYRNRSRGTQAVVDAFQGEDERGRPTEPTIDVVVMNISIAVGLTLTRASDMFFIERMWRPSDLEQAEARMERLGQRNRMIATYYDAPGTIDEMITNLLVHKAQVIAGVLDGRDLSHAEAAADVLGQLVGVEGSSEAEVIENLATMLEQQIQRNGRDFVDSMPILNALPGD